MTWEPPRGLAQLVHQLRARVVHAARAQPLPELREPLACGPTSTPASPTAVAFFLVSTSFPIFKHMHKMRAQEHSCVCFFLLIFLIFLIFLYRRLRK